MPTVFGSRAVFYGQTLRAMRCRYSCQQQFPAVENPGSVTLQEGIEEGIWINVDPIPGCIVCNIGESQWVITFKPSSTSELW
jgi:hypothetical protein